MKNLLLHIGDDPAMQARLQVALDLARANDGHITCLQTLTYAVLTPGDFYGSAIAAAMPAIKQESDAHRKAIESRLQNEDVSWEWVFMHGMAGRRSRYRPAVHAGREFGFARGSAGSSGSSQDPIIRHWRTGVGGMEWLG